MDESTRRLGPYELVRKIGRGAFGVVWLAEKRAALATTKFALKMPRDEDIDLEMFRQEAAIWVQASGHRNVLPLIEADIYDEQVVIVSEYMPDGSLVDWLARHGGKAPSAEAAIEIVDGVLAGLAHLHERQIIHHDLKPGNILLQRSTPLLADFGIARVLKSGYSANISGTLAYMAPEAFDGKRSEQTDLWAVSVILYQMLAGRLPFDQRDPASLFGAITRFDPPPLPEDVPEALRSVVERALQRDPARRYSSAQQMRDELREAGRRVWLKEYEAAGLRGGDKAPEPPPPPRPQPVTPAAAGDLDDELTRIAATRETASGRARRTVRAAFSGARARLRRTPKIWLAATAVLLLAAVGGGAWLALRRDARPDLRRWLAMLGGSGNTETVLRETSKELGRDPSNALALRARSSAYYANHEPDKGRRDAEGVERLLAAGAATAEEYEARCYARYRLKKLDEAVVDCTRAVELDPVYKWAFNTRANAYSDKYDYDRALADYNKAIELDPQFIWAYLNRGRIYSARYEYDRALADYNRVIELDPKNSPAYAARGMAFANKYDYDRAIADQNKAVELDPQDPSAYIARGDSYLSKYEYDRAIADYNRAVKLDPNSAAAYSSRGRAFAERYEYDRAIADHNKAIELDPRDATAHSGRGFAYWNKQEFETAIADQNKAIELDPQYKWAYYGRGLAHSSMGKYDLAIADHNRAIELDPEYAVAFQGRGNAHSGKGEYDHAIADYSKAVELDPQLKWAYHGRGYVYFKKEEYDRAVNDYEKAIGLDAKYASAYHGRGLVLAAKGEHDKAINDYNKTLELDPQYKWAYYSRGISYGAKEEYANASSDLSKVLKLDPKFPKAHLYRGLAYQGEGKLDLAISDLTTAAKLDPKDGMVYRRRGIIHANRGEYPKAIADYSKAISLEPRNEENYRLRSSAYSASGDYERSTADWEKAEKLKK